MIDYYLSCIPNDILYYYVWPNISNNIKMLLNKDLYYKYHNKIYSLNKNYIINIIKNDMLIVLNCLLKDYYLKFIENKKLYFDNYVFFNYYQLMLFICKKYNSKKCLIYIQEIFNTQTVLYKKQHKNYINKNILWIK